MKWIILILVIILVGCNNEGAIGCTVKNNNVYDMELCSAIVDSELGQYEKGYEQGVWDAVQYSNGSCAEGPRVLMSEGFRRCMIPKNPGLQNPEEYYEFEDNVCQEVI